WSAKVGKTVVTEMMNVLDKDFDLIQRCALFDLLAGFRFPPNFVSCQRFAQDCDQRVVARKEYAVERAILVDVFRSDIKTDEGLASAGDTGHETNGFCPFGFRIPYD